MEHLSDPYPGTSDQQHNPGDSFSWQTLHQAVESRAAARGWQAALELITAHWDRFIGTHPEAILASLRALPADAFIEIPSLLTAVNYVNHSVRGDGPGRFQDFAHDYPVRSGRKQDALDALIASAGRTAGHRTGGRLTEAAACATEGREALDSLSAHDRARIDMSLPHLLVQWGRAFELNDCGGVREYEEAWEIASLTNQPVIARRAAASLAWLHADHGRLNEAESWVSRAGLASAAVPRYDAPLHLASALIAVDRLDHTSMARHLQVLESVPLGEYWAADAWVRAWAARSEHDAVKVEGLIAEKLLGHPVEIRTAGVYGRYLACSRARLAINRGKAFPLQPVPDAPSIFDRLMIAAAAYRAGTMHTVLREAAPAATASQTPRLQSAALLLTAAARLSLGRTGGAAEAFRTAHAIIDGQQLLSCYDMIEPAHLADLCAVTGLATGVLLAHTEAGAAASGNTVALASLTKRERQLLAHLTTSHSRQGIADIMFISPNTVKTTTTSLYRKLGVHSRDEAADIAHLAGLA